MMHIEGKLDVSEQVSFTFPTDRCCNCFVSGGLQVLNQDTRRTSFLFAGGSEISFQLALPFCHRCKASARRRPPTLFKAFLLAALTTLGALAIVVPVALALDKVWLLDNSGLLSAALGVAAVVGWYGSRRKGPGQSSYYQPVRLAKVKQEFVSELVTGVTFRFTHARFAEAFKATNRVVVDRGVVNVQTS